MDRSLSHPSTLPLAILALCLAIATPAIAAEFAPLELGGADAVWKVGDAGPAGYQLVVSGPEDLHIVREFASGEEPSLSVFDAAGQSLPDGVYAYELTALPHVDAATRRRMQAMRESGLTAREAGLRLPRGERQTGYFSIAGGAFVLATGDEPAPEAAEGKRQIAERAVLLTNADGTIRNSLCVGFDCPAAAGSPSFGDTTILMMENNTRIKFDDTSASGFPANDWEIEANSNLSGGASYLGFNDCGASTQGGCAADLVFAVEAGAPASALYVDNGGRVGLGTNNPVVELHIPNGDTPTVRLEQTGSSGFQPQTWDIAGNETNFFIRDVTSGSTLPFRIRPGAPTSSIDIAATGRVGIRDSSPDDFLDIDVNANGGLTIESTVDGNLPQLTLIEPDRTWRFRVNNAGTFVFTDATAGSSPFQITGGSANNLLSLGGSQVTVNGDFTVTGVKNFMIPDPTDASSSLYYVALEGPEAGTYYRGTAVAVNGKAVIELPEVFANVTEAEGMTVQITPVGGLHQFWVEERTPERLVIREASGKPQAEFDFFVQGVRLGYADYQVKRPNPASPSALK